MPADVSLLSCLKYEDLLSRITPLLDSILPRLSGSEFVLIKPNLVSGSNGYLSCTHARVVETVCLYFLNRSVRIVVGDSPAFGSAAQVAYRTGLLPLLARYNVPLTTLNDPVPVRLASGLQTQISRQALECDLLLNLPKLKAHNQMRVSAGIKNLFGCVSGIRKAFKHFSLGDRGALFPSFLVEVMLALPPAPTLLDAVVSMHQAGPIRGLPYPSGFLAASLHPVALDTCVCSMLGLSPEKVPLWAECAARGLPGAHRGDLCYPFAAPEAFDLSGFEWPDTLSPQRFSLPRMILSGLRRAWKRFPAPGHRPQ